MNEVVAKDNLNTVSFDRSAPSKNIYETPIGLPSVQLFPPHVTQFLSKYRLEMEQFES